MTDIATDSTPAGHLRALLVERLTTQGQLRTPEVAAAFRRVPREAFVPAGTSLEDAYRDDVVVTKRRPEDGRASSSVSAPWLSLSTPVVLRSPQRITAESPSLHMSVRAPPPGWA
jgi:protein-L-isoaspartate O-methyltransferase